ncbi:MAG: hypothetical protein K5746_10430 [Clostridiales bacterium]|nr:hypothetical protein [Clostridiales bacterium]
MTEKMAVESGIVARLAVNPPPMTGRTFLTQLFRILIRLSVAQVVVSLAVRITGIGVLRILICLYTLLLLYHWFCERVQSAEIILTEQYVHVNRIRQSGKKHEIHVPLSQIAAVRKHIAGENLRITYESVTVPHRSLETPLRIRAVWITTVFSARLARFFAGREFLRPDGNLIVAERDGEKQAILIPLNGAFEEALSELLPDRFGKDDRMEREPLVTLRGRALQRAFPQLYPHVLPLIPEGTDELPSRKKRKKKKTRRKPESWQKKGKRI